MDKFTTEIIQTLAQNGNISEVFHSHLEKAVNTLLAQELTAFLNYEKYDRIGFNFGNSQNGAYERTLHTEYGDLKLEIPCDRNGDFRQQTIAPTESVHVWRELLENFRERGGPSVYFKRLKRYGNDAFRNISAHASSHVVISVLTKHVPN